MDDQLRDAEMRDARYDAETEQDTIDRDDELVARALRYTAAVDSVISLSPEERGRMVTLAEMYQPEPEPESSGEWCDVTGDELAVLQSVVGGEWTMRQVRRAKSLPPDVWVIEDDDGDELAYVGHRIDAAAIVAAVNAGRATRELPSDRDLTRPSELEGIAGPDDPEQWAEAQALYPDDPRAQMRHYGRSVLAPPFEPGDIDHADKDG